MEELLKNLNIEYKKLENVFASTLEGNLKKEVFYSNN